MQRAAVFSPDHRDARVLRLLAPYELWCFGRNRGGAPRFPRALPRDVRLAPFPG